MENFIFCAVFDFLTKEIYGASMFEFYSNLIFCFIDSLKGNNEKLSITVHFIQR